jgi:hypothetical protein
MNLQEVLFKELDMIENKDIRAARLIFEKINFDKLSEPPVGAPASVEMKVSFQWNLKAMHKESTGCQFTVVFTIDSQVMKALMGGTVTIDFLRKISQEEVRELSSEKVCIMRIVDYLILFIANITTQMGVTPLLIDKASMIGLIEDSKKGPSPTVT